MADMTLSRTTSMSTITRARSLTQIKPMATPESIDTITKPVAKPEVTTVAPKTETESTAVDKALHAVSTLDVSATASLPSLTDVSRDMMAALEPPRTMGDAFADLRACFKVSSNKIEYNDKGIPTSNLCDLIMMKDNPLASSKDKSESRMFRMFACKEFSNENTEFLDATKKMIKASRGNPELDNPKFVKHMKFVYLNFMAESGKQQINISSAHRFEAAQAYTRFTQAEEAFAADASDANKQALKEAKKELLDTMTTSVKEIYHLLGDTRSRFESQHHTFKSDLKRLSALPWQKKAPADFIEASRIETNIKSFRTYTSRVEGKDVPKFKDYGL